MATSGDRAVCAAKGPVLSGMSNSGIGIAGTGKPFHCLQGWDSEFSFGGRKEESGEADLHQGKSCSRSSQPRHCGGRAGHSGVRSSAMYDCVGGSIRSAPKEGEGDLCGPQQLTVVLGSRKRRGRGDETVAEGTKSWKRKGYHFRRSFANQKERQGGEISNVEQSQATKGQFWRWARAGSSAVVGGRVVGTKNFGRQPSGVGDIGTSEDHEREIKSSQFVGRGKGRQLGQKFGRQFGWQFKTERCGQSDPGLSSGTPEDEKGSHQARETLRAGSGRKSGCPGNKCGLQPERLQSATSVGKAANSFSGSRGCQRVVADSVEGPSRDGNAAKRSTAEGGAPELLGRRLLAGRCSPYAAFGSFGEAKVRGRAKSAGAHCQLLEGDPRFRKAQSGRSRSWRRWRQERKEGQEAEGGRAQRSMKARSQVFGTQCLEEDTVSQLIRLGHGSFARFARTYEKVHSEQGESTLMSNEIFDVALFPSSLPWVKPPKKSRGRRGPSSAQRWEAYVRLHWLWGLFNFLESGSPCQRSASQAAADRACRGVWTSCHENYARTMYRKLLRYVTHPEGTWERGTAKLDDIISRIRLSFYDPSVSFEEAVSGAMSVNPSRISLPEKGGILDPAQHLTGRQLEQFRSMHRDIPAEGPRGKDVKPCHKVDSKDWPVLLKKLFEADMITFLPVEKVYQERGRPVKGGLFCVAHKPSSDRLINDRRPLNIREDRLDWSTLPCGSMLCQIILEKGESIRCSGDDLSNYFYLIRHAEEWFPRNAFGDPIMGSELSGLGLEDNRKYLPAFKVVCMGDTNGVDIAQATHESVLRSAGCLDPSATLVYGRTFPAASTFEGLYIDDHLVFQILPNKPSRNRGPHHDEKLLKASRDKYSSLNLPRSEKKAFEKQYDFKAWGTQVCSETGRVGVPLEKLRQIECLIRAIILEGWASRKAMQKLMGLCIHPFMHRRELMSLFHHAYIFIEKLPDTGVRKLPAYVKDELLCALLVLPLAEANVRSPVSTQISATDASSKMGGRASTLTSKSLAKTLYRFSEKKGEHTRLDWQLHAIDPPSRMEEAPLPLVEAMQKHCWTSTHSMRFSKKHHINLLELEMVKQEIKDRANGMRGFCRVVNLCDSRVVVGAFGKGRSSSRNMNHKLRSCLPWLLVADIHLVNLWVPTDKNPADFPSRGRKIPWPTPSFEDPLLDSRLLKAVQVFRSVGVQGLLEREARVKGVDSIFNSQPSGDSDDCLQAASNMKDDNLPPKTFASTGIVKPDRHHLIARVAAEANVDNNTHLESTNAETLAFREIFSGKGRLTEQMRRQTACKILEPVEYMKGGVKIEKHDILNRRSFNQLKIEAARPKQVWHFGIPCGSFSILQHSNKGTRRKHCPEGLGILLRETVGNEILRRTLVLIDILEKNGNFWTVENPSSSYLWCMPRVVKKIQQEGNSLVSLDQCCYGLKLRDSEGELGPCKKPTKFLGNLPGLHELKRSCSCAGLHVHAVGGVKTKQGWKRRSELAGHYPLKLCTAYASLVNAAVASS